MGRYRHTILGLLLTALVGCGQPTAISPNEAVGRVALIEPTGTPTATQPVVPTSTATTPPPSPTRPVTATIPMHANGLIPEGWRIYVGTSVPLSIAHHSDWGVQRQQMGENYAVAFTAPDNKSLLIVGPQDDLTAGLPRLVKLSGAEIEQALADTGLTTDGGALAAMCDGAVTFDGVNLTPIAHSQFITLNYHCRFQGIPSRLQFHMGMVQNRAWVVLMIAPKANYDELDMRYFSPMLASLKFD